MGTACGSRTRFHWIKKASRCPDLSRLVPISEYARENYLTVNAARYRILTWRIAGYKIRGKWYVDPTSDKIFVE